MNKLIILTIVFVVSFSSALGWDNHGERCVTSETSDSCDPSKYLKCRGGRCECDDTANQIYTYVYAEQTRSKRSPKKGRGGGGKKILAGAAVAGGGAFVGYQLGKAANGGGGDSSSSSSRQRDQDRRRIRVYACYARNQGPCVLDSTRYNIFSSVFTTTPASVSHNATNSTDANITTTVPPTTTKKATLEITRIPKCVQNSECRPISEVMNKYGDSRIGECSCSSGFRSTTSDICVSVSGALSNNYLPFSSLSLSFFFILFTFFNK